MSWLTISNLLKAHSFQGLSLPVRFRLSGNWQPLVNRDILYLARVKIYDCFYIFVSEEVRQNGIMTAEEYDRQNRIMKIKSFESEETVIAQPLCSKSPSLSEKTFDEDLFDTSSIRLSTEAHIKRKMFRKVGCPVSKFTENDSSATGSRLTAQLDAGARSIRDRLLIGQPTLHRATFATE